jgi:tRNA1(Val) A37 N6-methylase TrmN6
MTKIPDQAPNALEVRHREYPKNCDLSTIMGGQVGLYQPIKGYRAGLDAALLAAYAARFLKPEISKRVLELGCGAGAALLALKKRRPLIEVTGLEKDEFMLSLAQQNAILNDMDDKAQFHHAKIGDLTIHDRDRFDMVIANPPYFDNPNSMRPVGEARKGAWMNEEGLSVWTGQALQLVRDGGQVVFIHRADRLGDLMRGLLPLGMGGEIVSVHPFVDSPAKRVIVSATRLSKTPLILHPPLVLHERGQRGHKAAIDCLLKGDDWEGLKP